MRLTLSARNQSTSNTLEPQSLSDNSNAVSETHTLSSMSSIARINSATEVASTPEAIKKSAPVTRKALLRNLPFLRGRLQRTPPDDLRQATSNKFRAYGGESQHMSDDQLAEHLKIVIDRLSYLLDLETKPIRDETLAELKSFDEIEFGENYLQEEVQNLIEQTNACFADIHAAQSNKIFSRGRAVELPPNIQSRLTELAQAFSSESENKLEIIDELQITLDLLAQKIVDVTQDKRYTPLSRLQSDYVRAIYDRLEPCQ